jgi:hypothetical protein
VCSYTPAVTLAITTNYEFDVAAINSFGQSTFNSEAFHMGGFNSQFNGNVDGWEAQQGADWYDDSNTLYTSGEPDGWSSVNYDGTFKDFDYSARVKRDGGIYDDGTYYWAPANSIYLRMGDSHYTDDGWFPGYRFTYYDFQDLGFQATYVISKLGVDGSYKIIKHASTSAIVEGDWNTLRVSVSGSTFHFYINDHLIYTFSDSTFKTGSVGMGMYDMSGGDSTTFSADWAVLSPYGVASSSDMISAEQQALNDAGTDISSDQGNLEKDKHLK